MTHQEGLLGPSSQLTDVIERLKLLYGERIFPGRDNPLDELILTILSQNTTDINSHRTFRSLRAYYPDWYAVLAAPTEELYEVIKSAGLGNIKAPRIQQTLHTILERTGDLSLDFLGDMELDDARNWLRSLQGIGPKTAACVLMFALGMPALPVDTHVHRVSLRLGLIAPKVSAERAHKLLESVVNPEEVYSFHINMIAHGKKVCHALRPACSQCALSDLCMEYLQAA